MEEIGDIYLRLYANLKIQSRMGVLVHPDPSLLPLARWHITTAVNLAQSF